MLKGKPHNIPISGQSGYLNCKLAAYIVAQVTIFESIKRHNVSKILKDKIY